MTNFTDNTHATISLVEFTQLKTTIPQRRTYDYDTVAQAVDQGNALIKDYDIDGYFVLAEYPDDDDNIITTVVFQSSPGGYYLNDKMEVTRVS